jgi:phosphohistidine phosphatase SixA
VYLVRHAEAAPGEPDELRPLTPEGRETAQALARLFVEHRVTPDAILTSPLLRARQTGEELGKAVGVDAKPDERLAPGATADDLRAAVAGRGEIVVAIGHQPDCGQIAAALGDGAEPRFPPGYCVRLDVADE